MRSASHGIALLSVTIALACARQPQPGPHPVGQATTQVLDREAEQALEAIRAARAALGESVARAETHLSEAEATLLRVRRYYLPLIEARDAALDARRVCASGDVRSCSERLGQVEDELVEIARLGDQHVARELEEAIETVADARAEPEDVEPKLDTLVTRLEMMLVKGALIVDRE